MFYAAYGSNLHPMRLVERLPSARLCGSSELEGWGLRFHKRGQDGSSKCNMIPASETLYVAIYEINPAEKVYLDEAEGLGNGYQEKAISVPNFGTCFVYVAQDSHIDTNLRPFSWYKELVILGCLHHGFPADYVHAIQRIAPVQDHDIERHKRGMDLVRKIRYLSPPLRKGE